MTTAEPLTTEALINRQSEYIAELELVNRRAVAREQELNEHALALEAKVYQATDRAAQSRESIVRMREKLRLLKERALERDKYIEQQEAMHQREDVFNEGYSEGLKEALRVAHRELGREGRERRSVDEMYAAARRTPTQADKDSEAGVLCGFYPGPLPDLPELEPRDGDDFAPRGDSFTPMPYEPRAYEAL